MALVVLGTTKCALCGKVLDEESGAVLFPPMFVNRLSRLHVLNDAAVHQTCLDSYPGGDAAKRLLDAYLDRRTSSARTCSVCHGPIADPDDHFGTGLLFEDASSPLFALNFLEFHRSHFGLWEHSAAFKEAALALQGSPSWDGPCVVFDPLPRWLARTGA